MCYNYVIISAVLLSSPGHTLLAKNSTKQRFKVPFIIFTPELSF